MADIKEILRGQVTLDLSPFSKSLESIPGLLSQASQKIEAAFGTSAAKINQQLKGVATEAGSVKTSLDGIATRATSAGKGLQNMADGAAKLRPELAGLSTIMRNVGKAADDIAVPLQAVAVRMNAIAQGAKDFAAGLNAAAAAGTNAGKALGQAAAGIDQVGQKAGVAETGLKNLTTQLGTSTTAATKLGTETLDAGAALQLARQEADDATKSVRAFGTAATAAAASSAKLASAGSGGSGGGGGGGGSSRGRGTLPLPDDSEIRAFTSDLEKANQKLSEAERSVYAIYRAGAQIAQLSFVFSVFGSAALGAMKQLIAGADAFDVFSRKAFASMAASSSPLAQSTANLKLLQAEILKLGGAIGTFDPAQIAQALYFWQSATGQVIGSQEELAQVLQGQLLPVLQAAAISEVDTATAVRGVTSAVGEFGLSMDQAGHVAQVMLATTQLTNAEFGDMIQAFTYLGTGAHALGLSIEEVATVMGRLSDVNLRGGNAGRALGQVFAALIAPSVQARQELEQLFGGSKALGDSWEDILFPGGKFIGLLTEFDADGTKHAGLLEEIAKRTQNLTDHDREQVLEKITTRNAYRALSPLLQDYVDQLRTTGEITQDNTTKNEKFLATLRNDPSVLFSKQWEAYAGALREQIGRATNQIKDLLIQLGYAAANALLPVLDAVARLAQGLKNLAAEHPNLLRLVMLFGTLATVLGTSIAVMGVFIGNITSFLAAIKLIGPALEAVRVYSIALTGSMATTLIPLLAAVVTLAMAWHNNWMGLRDTIQGLGGVLQDTLGLAHAALDNILAAMKAFFELRWGDLGGALREALTSALAIVLQWAAALGPTLARLVQGLLQDVDGLLSRFGGRAYEAGKTWALNITAGIRAVLFDQLKAITDQANRLIGGIQTIVRPSGTQVVGRAAGGVVGEGEVTLAGEQGPELLILPKGTTVVPAPATAAIQNRMAGGGVVGGANGASGPASGGFLQGVKDFFFGKGQDAGNAFDDGFSSAVGDLQLPNEPGPVLQWARSLGLKVGDQFIAGFKASDFSELESLLDSVKGTIEQAFSSGALGGGADAVDKYIDRFTRGMNVLEQIIGRVRQGLQVTDVQAADLANVAGDLAPDLIAVANAWGQVQRDAGAVKSQQDIVDGLEHEKALLDDQKSAIQDKIADLNAQKEPYQDELRAIDKVIEGIQRQKRALDLLKEPLQDAKDAIDDVVRGLQRTLEPLEDAKRQIALQKQAYDDAKAAIDQVIDNLNQQKQALEDQKIPIQAVIDGLQDQIDAIKEAKRLLDLQKEPLEDAKQALQDQLAIVNEQVAALRERLDAQKQAQADALQGAQDELAARRDALDLAKEAEDDRHQAVQDRLDAEQAALDIIKEQEQVTADANQARIDADKAALDSVKARFALEEQIAAARVEQAGLLGASSNVTDFLKFQEAALKRQHAGVTDPEEARIKREQDAEQARQKAADTEIARREKLLKGETDAEKARQDAASRAIKQQEREATLLERRIKAQQDADERANKQLERQIAAGEQQAKGLEKQIAAVDKQLAAIERQEQLLDRQSAQLEHEKDLEQAKIDAIEKVEKQLDRQIELQNRAKAELDRQEQVLERQERDLDRQIERINHDIELENRKKENLDDQLRALDRQGELLDRQIRAQQDLKNGPQDAIDALDEQIRGEQKKEDSIDRQEKAKDRQLKIEQDILKQKQEQQKKDEAALADAEALLKFHEKIRDTIAEAGQKLQERQQDVPGQGDQPADKPRYPAGVDPNAPGSQEVSPQLRALILATALWDEYRRKMAATFQAQVTAQDGTFGALATHFGALTGNLTRLFSSPTVQGFFQTAREGLQGLDDLIKGRGPEVLAQELENALKAAGIDIKDYEKGLIDEDLVRQLAEKARGTVAGTRQAEQIGLDGKATGFALDTVAILEDLAKAFLQGLSTDGVVWKAFAKGLKLMMFEVPKQTFLESANFLGDLISLAITPSTGTASLEGKIVPFFRDLFTTTIPKAVGGVGDLLFDALFGSTGKGVASFKFVDAFKDLVPVLKTLFTTGDGLFSIVTKLALGFKELAGGPLLPLTVVIDAIILAFENWHTVQDRLVKAFQFVAETITTKLGPPLKELWIGTNERIGPAFKNLMVILGFVDEVIKTLIKAVAAFIDAMSPFWGPLFRVLIDVVTAVLNVLKNLWFIFLDILGLNFGKLGEDVSRLFGDLARNLGTIFKDIFEGILAYFTSLPKALLAAGQQIWDAICGLFLKIYDYLLGHSIIPDIINGIVKWFKDLPELLHDALVALGTKIIETFDAILQKADEWLGISADTGLRKFFGDGLDLLLKLAGDFVGGWDDDKRGVLGWLGYLTRTSLSGWDLLLGVSGNTGLRKLATDGWALLVGTVVDLVGNFDEDKKGVLGWMGFLWRSVLDKARAYVGAEGDASLVGIVKKGFANIITNLTGWVGNWDQNKDGFLGWLGWGFRTAANLVLTAIGVDPKTKGSIIAAFSDGFGAVVQWIGDNFIGTWDAEKGTGLLGMMAKGMKALGDKIGDALGKTEDDGIRGVFKKLGLAVDTVWGFVDKLIKRLGEFALPGPLQALLEKFGILGGQGGSPSGSPAPAPKPAQGGGGDGPVHDDWVYEQGPGGKFSHQNANAIDMALPEGTTVYAVGDGVVSSGYNSSYGNYIDLTTSDGNTFRYGHLSGIDASGAVGYGQAIGRSGNTGHSTGAHLHFEHSGGPDYRFGDVYDWVTGGQQIDPDAEGLPMHGTRINHNGAVPSAAPGTEQPGRTQSVPNPGQRPSGPLAAVYDYVINFLRGALGLSAPPGSGTHGPGTVPGGTPGVYDGAVWGDPSTALVDSILAGTGLAGEAGYIDQLSKALGVPEAMIMTILRQESGYNSNGGLVKYNNPTGLTGTGWPGQTGNTAPGEFLREFATFDTIENGLLASVQNMASSFYGGLTVRRFLAQWLTGDPDKANDELYSVNDYVGTFLSVAEQLGLAIDPDSAIVHLAKGAYDVPSDNLPALLHRGEMVIPRSFAESLRAALTGGPDLSAQLRLALPQLRLALQGGPGGAAGETVEHHYHLHVDGVATATSPEDNVRILKRLAHVTPGLYHGKS